MRQCLIIVAKEPAVGQTKTRLAAGIGAERALALYQSFLTDTIDFAERTRNCAGALSFWSESSAKYFRQ